MNDIAQSGTTVPSKGNGWQVNYKNPINNGTLNEAVGAIQILSTRSSDFALGNSSASNAIFTVNGATINGVANVVIENASSQNFAILDDNTGTGTMGLALGNDTENIISMDGSGSIAISNVISSDSGVGYTPLTFTGTGSGTINIAGTANTWTGEINITGAEADFAAAGSFGDPANTITIDGGRLGIASGASIDLSGHSIFLGATPGTSISAVGASGVLTYNGVLADKDNLTHGILVKQGKGALVLGGANTYSGDTFINNGTLQITNGDYRLPVGTAINLGQSASANVGTFDLNGYGQEIAGLNSVPGNNTSAGAKNIVTNSTGPGVLLKLSGSGNYFYGNGTTNNSGVIVGPINILKAGSGVQVFGDTNGYTGYTDIEAGTLALTNNSSMPGSTLIMIDAHGTLDVSGRANGGFTLNSGQTMVAEVNPVESDTACSTIIGNLNTAFGSSLGFQFGIPASLNVFGNVTLNGTTAMVITNYSITNINDTLIVSNGITYGGTLNLYLTQTLTNGDQFKLFTAGGYSGAFTNITPATPGANLAWDTNSLVIDGTLKIVSTATPPQITGIGLNGTTLTITATNGSDNGNFVLLESTNVSLPLAQWTPILTNNFDSSGNLDLSTNILNDANAQDFYILQAQ